MVGTPIERFLMYRQLAMGAVAFGDDLSRPFNLCEKAEFPGVFADHLNALFKQVRIGDMLSAAEIDEAVSIPIALREPPVFAQKQI